MKKNLLILFLSFFTLGLSAQMLHFSIDSMQVEGSTNEFDVVGHSYIVNTTNGNLSLKWVRERNALSPGWESAVCDKNNCYPTNISTNVVDAGNPMIPVELGPGDTSIIDVHVYPYGLTGSGIVEVCLYEVGGTDAIGCMVYNVTIGTTSTKEVDKEQIQIYPNPTSDYFKLRNVEGVRAIHLYNMLGRSIRNYEVGVGKNYYIGDLPAGMYLASIIGKNGEVIKTTRVIKRYIAP
ncbi:MAG: T9SS type A sorting domain-containing protein, partial [Saprospiraceae bacterium]|nr:T9SS type A sorting domain-containing protein [Saprospiraceae bacterium]